jgi:hypothetical protein
MNITRAAAALGRLGGKSKSAAKRRASANNGKLGGRPKGTTMKKLTTEESEAIREAIGALGARWKTRLAIIWTHDTYGAYGLSLWRTSLQSLRNRIGPSGLSKLRPSDYWETRRKF